MMLCVAYFSSVVIQAKRIRLLDFQCIFVILALCCLWSVMTNLKHPSLRTCAVGHSDTFVVNQSRGHGRALVGLSPPP